MTSELYRSIAAAVARLGAPVNAHELWAALEVIDGVRPGLIVDIGSGPALQWAWWSLGAQVIGLQSTDAEPLPGFTGGLPEAVTVLIGDPRDPSTRLRVADQIARRPVDVLVLGAEHTEEAHRATYRGVAPMVRPGGLVVVKGIRNRRTPGVAAFWRGLAAPEMGEFVDASAPDGFGIVRIEERGRGHVGEQSGRRGETAPGAGRGVGPGRDNRGDHRGGPASRGSNSAPTRAVAQADAGELIQ
jgi:hypothetical protein